MTTATMQESELRAMNAQALKSVADLPKGKDYVMEPKLDGFRLIAVVREADVQFYTRAMKRQDGKVPHIEAELLRLFPAGTVLDGEIMALTMAQDGSVTNNFEHVQSVMLSKPETAVRKNAAWPVQYSIFDMTFDAGTDLRGMALRDRKVHLHSYLEGASSASVMETAMFPISQDTHDTLVSLGFEGSVVKDLDSRYANGMRGAKFGWFKMKAVWDMDVIVVGFTPGRNGFTGMVGAVEFAQPDENGNLVKRGQASGMDLKERRYMTDHADEMIGTVVTVKHNGVFPDGIHVRHPQFLRTREDKPASEVEWHDA